MIVFLKADVRPTRSQSNVSLSELEHLKQKSDKTKNPRQMI